LKETRRDGPEKSLLQLRAAGLAWLKVISHCSTNMQQKSFKPGYYIWNPRDYLSNIPGGVQVED